jgi:hypothetical protein
MHPDFDLPTIAKITGRKSTITGMFFAALTPVIAPTDAEVRQALRVLGMEEGAVVCAYCGDKKSEWDHLRPITVKRRPTGYVSEIANLVPCCGKCNQSKGNKPWLEWMRSSARHSPTTRRVSDLTLRIRRLKAYERWREPICVDYEDVLGADVWCKHLAHLERVLACMVKAEKHAVRCRRVLKTALTNDEERA